MKTLLKKGQVSLEYLMTYGIAIAIVVIAVAALYSMGVFNPSSSTNPCSPCFANFAYVDYAGGVLIAKNGPRALTGVSCTADSGVCNVSGTNGVDLSANQQFNITGITSTSGTDVILTLSYTAASSGLSHNDTATIHN